jgi:hypothetical protein
MNTAKHRIGVRGYEDWCWHFVAIGSIHHPQYDKVGCLYALFVIRCNWILLVQVPKSTLFFFAWNHFGG